MCPCQIALQINAEMLFEMSGLKNMAIVLTTEGHQKKPLYNVKSVKSHQANWKLNCWPGRQRKGEREGATALE